MASYCVLSVQLIVAGSCWHADRFRCLFRVQYRADVLWTSEVGRKGIHHTKLSESNH